MTIFLTIIYTLVFVGLLLVVGARPQPSTVSRFELSRRAKAGQPEAQAAWRRDNLLADIRSLQGAAAGLLLVGLTGLGMTLFGWATGLVTAGLVALLAGPLANLRFVSRPANAVYARLEPWLLDQVERHPRLARLLRSALPLSGHEVYHPQSRAELLEMIARAEPEALSSQEKRMLASALDFESRLVSDIMTPRERLHVIAGKELLGPLVLDELHKTGHSRFPVTGGDLDRIIGILYLPSLLDLSRKRSLTAEKAMGEVHFISRDQTLPAALAAFLNTGQPLLVAVDDRQRTAGVITLSAVVAALVGRDLSGDYQLPELPADSKK